MPSLEGREPPSTRADSAKVTEWWPGVPSARRLRDTGRVMFPDSKGDDD
jgi:hypothetical protein